MLSVAAVAVGGDILPAVAVQAGAHAVGYLAVGVGVALIAAVPGGGVLTVVKMDVGGQGSLAHPAQGFGGIGRVVGVGSGMQGQQARVCG